MIVSYKLLQTFFAKKLPKPEVIAEALTFHAFEIEGIEQKGSDTAIDIKVLPNRAHDCLSHRGVARELAAILELPLKAPNKRTYPKASKGVPVLSVSIKDPRARRYIGLVVDGITIKESPQWLVDALATLGQRSINAIVDATNYVMFMLGQPLHVFDYDRISGRTIVVRPGVEGETLMTLDGKEVYIDSSIMVIADQRDPLAIAGVKGGTHAEITNETTRIVIESANFDASTIRKTSQQLGIKTDASKRFESDLTPLLAEEAMCTVAALIVELSGGKATRVGAPVDKFRKKQRQAVVSVSRSDINRILGTQLTARAIEQIWKRLGFSFHIKRSADGIVYGIAVPAERLDIRIKEDLVEEVGRMAGYHTLLPTMPVEPVNMPTENREWVAQEIAREVMLGEGFSDVYTYAFNGKGEVEVANPIALDKKFLRNKLMDGLKDALVNNLKHDTSVRIFEFGHIFGITNGTIREEHSFAALVGFQKRKPEEQKRDFFLLKGVLSGVCDALRITGLRFETAGGELVASVHIGDTLIGTMSIDGFEVDFSKMVECSDRHIHFVVPSRFPVIMRDVSLFVPPETPAGRVRSVIMAHAGELARSVDLIDVFEQPDMNRKSFAFRIALQSFEKTLSDVEANAIYDTVVDSLRKEDPHWQVRT